MNRLFVVYAFFAVIINGCGEQASSSEDRNNPPAFSNYAGDRDFLNQYVSVIELKNDSSKILIVPEYQGRVMTSTCNGDSGESFGWINYDLIKSKQVNEHINAYGGEERIWLAPEGGQFAFFFRKDAPFDFEHWFTPKEFDTEKFDVVEKTDSGVLFKKDMVLENRSGNNFSIHIDRYISLVTPKNIRENLSLEGNAPIRIVAYKSVNTLINTGSNEWSKKSGAPAIWLLGMLKPSSETTIVLPLRKNPGDTGEPVNDQYFGSIPTTRWKIDSGHAYLKADGKFRSKVGVPPLICSCQRMDCLLKNPLYSKDII